MPTSCGDVLLESGILVRVVLLHHFVANRARKIENVGWVLIHPLEVLVQCIEDELVNGFGEVPPPLSIEVRITHAVEYFLAREVVPRFLGK